MKKQRVLIPLLLSAGVFGWLAIMRRSSSASSVQIQIGDEIEVPTKTVTEDALVILDGKNSRTTVVRVEDDFGTELFGPITAFLFEATQHVVRERVVPIKVLVKRKDILSVSRNGQVIA